MWSIKGQVKKHIGPLVWESLGRVKLEYNYSKRIYHCDSILIPLFKKYLSKKRGFYVDVGTADGRAASNTFHLEKMQGWHGVLVEPIMHLYFQTRKIRDLEKNHIFNCACVDFDYKESLIEFYYSGLMTIATSGTSKNDARKWAESGARFLGAGEDIQKTWSLARTLDSILVESNAPNNIDFLTIDVEGFEYQVLKGIDFERFTFDYLLIETVENSPSCNLLNDLGYKCQEIIEQNILFINKKLPNQL